MTSRLRLGLTARDSVPEFETLRRPALSAPNVVVIVLDDLGFAQLGSYGSDIATPHIDRLAAGGLRYNRFHVTALCSPTRASLLTGRNAHAVGMGFLSEVSLGFPGYSARLPRSAATLARILRDAGYATLAVGKWHLAPGDAQSAAGPFDRWPLGVGFERYYGFLQGETNQWTPSLVRDNHFLEPPRSFAEGYHLTEDLADNAIGYVYDVVHGTPGKPFFLYFAPGAMHAPHHAAPEWVAPYANAFDDGWEHWRERTFARQRTLGVVPEGALLTERPPWIAPWRDLSPEQRRRYARTQEVYAGFLTHTDAQIGRLLAALDASGTLENTLIMLISDNGASSEGGPDGSFNLQRTGPALATAAPDALEAWGGPDAYNHYSWGWAWAGNTPFRLWKRYSWLGGTRTPLIVSWPRRIAARGEVRTQFCHVVDLLPTVLESCGVSMPDVVDGVTQQRVDGASLVATFADPAAPNPRDVQYFETTGSRSIVADGWKATTDHVGRATASEQALLVGSRAFEDDRWSLVRMDTDFSEAIDVADQHPDVLKRLQELWLFEAGRNNVLPLEDVMHGRNPAAIAAPEYPPLSRSVFRPGGSPILERSVPSLAAGGLITAHVAIPTAGAAGILCAMGDWSGGLAFYVLDGTLVFALSAGGESVRVSAVLGDVVGQHRLACALGRAAAGMISIELWLDDAIIGSESVRAQIPPVWQYGLARLRLGYDQGFPVGRDYRPPFRWTGGLESIVFEVPEAVEQGVGERLRASLRSE